MASRLDTSKSIEQLMKKMEALTDKVMANTKSLESNVKSVKKLGQAHKKTSTTVDNLVNSQKKATKSGGIFDTVTRRNAGSMGIFSNSLSTVRSKLLIFNFFVGAAIKATSQLGRQASQLGSVETAFNTLSGATENSQVAMSKLQAATNGTLSSFDLFKQANNAMILGVSKNSDEMAEMFDIAQRLGRAVGTDTASSVESLVTGIGRQSRQMLDNIGIIVKAEEAYEKYARQLRINATDLDDAQKKQAFFNAAMGAARTAVARLGEEQLSAADRFDKFDATLDNFQKAIGAKVTPVILNFLERTAKFMTDIMETDLDKALRQLREAGLSVQQIAKAQEQLEKSQAISKIAENQKKLRNELQQSFLLTDKTYSALGLNIVRLSEHTTKAGQQSSNFNKINSVSVDILRNRVKELQNEQEVLANTIPLNFEAIDQNTQEIEQINKIISIQLELNKAKSDESGIIKDQVNQNKNLNEVVTKKIKMSEEDSKITKTRLELLDEEIEKFQLTIQLRKQFEAELSAIRKQTKEEIKKDIKDIANVDVQSRIDARRQAGIDLGFISEKQALEIEAANQTSKAVEFGFIKRSEALGFFNERLIKLTEDNIKFTDSEKDILNIINKFSSTFSDAIINANGFKDAISATSVAFRKSLTAMALEMASRAALFSVFSLIPGVGSAFSMANIGKFALTGAVAHKGGFIKDDGQIQRFATGGSVRGGDNVPILAQGGEFVMQRSAVDSIGIENLNRMNQGGAGGGITVNVSGNVMSQDYVEGELAEQIKEAIRRGNDFGVS